MREIARLAILPGELVWVEVETEQLVVRMLRARKAENKGRMLLSDPLLGAHPVCDVTR